MAGSVNKVILLGNLGRDPEIRTPNGMAGDKIVNLSIATSETWKDKHSGERKEKTEWHRVVIFNPALADIAERFLKKGSSVYIEGALQTRKWTDNAGVERYSTEIVIGRFKGELTLLGGGGGGDQRPQDEHSGYGTTRNREPSGAQGRGMDNSGRSTGGGGGGGGWEPPADLDDEIPFIGRWDMPLGRTVP